MSLKLVIDNDPLLPEDRRRENEIARFAKTLQTTGDRKQWGIAWYQMQKLIMDRPQYVIDLMEKEKGLGVK